MKACRFYGWTLAYVESMPYADYIRALKCMIMLDAREGLAEINYANFADFDSKYRDSVQRSLKQQAELYLWRPVLDFKEVAANLARKLAGGRR